MSNLQKDSNDATYQILAYEPGRILINANWHTQSILIMPHELITDWRPQQFDALTPEDLFFPPHFKPQLFLLGTGSMPHYAAPSLYGHLINLGIGVEIMNTQAACRTYALLTAEKRDVLAALLL